MTEETKLVFKCPECGHTGRFLEGCCGSKELRCPECGFQSTDREKFKP